jgi:gamma-glutamylaminecyclotransferase
MKLLFVYGTLKRGFRNQRYLSDAVFLGQFSTDRCYSMFDFTRYPAVTQSGRDAIAGEVYQISPHHLAATDTLEGYPEFFQRVLISTPFGDAWMYIVEPVLCDDKPRLSGQWYASNDA